MEDSDPFGSIVSRCQPTSSQEDILRLCPFARESEVFPGDDEESPSSPAACGIPVESTEIMMVSPPESPREKSPPHEEFQTPPEGSLPASSEEQRSAAEAFDTRSGEQFHGVGGGENVAVDRGCTASEGVVDLGKDSANLGLSGVKPGQRRDRGGGEGLDAVRSLGVEKVIASEAFESESEKFKVLRGKSSLVCHDISCESVPKKLKLSDPPNTSASDTEPLIIETFPDENTNTEAIHLEVEEIGGRCEDNVYVKVPVRESKSGESVSEGSRLHKNVEDLDKFKYDSSISVIPSKNISDVGSRRELPSSISGRANNAGIEMRSSTSDAKSQGWKDLLYALKMVAKEKDNGFDEGADFLQTAKRRGLIFPRPSWWSADDYGD
ncbi:hypothetical protein NMG60_11030225 [Bertholletia excelsa]